MLEWLGTKHLVIFQYHRNIWISYLFTCYFNKLNKVAYVAVEDTKITSYMRTVLLVCVIWCQVQFSFFIFGEFTFILDHHWPSSPCAPVAAAKGSKHFVCILQFVHPTESRWNFILKFNSFIINLNLVMSNGAVDVAALPTMVIELMYTNSFRFEIWLFWWCRCCWQWCCKATMCFMVISCRENDGNDVWSGFIFDTSQKEWQRRNYMCLITKFILTYVSICFDNILLEVWKFIFLVIF